MKELKLVKAIIGEKQYDVIVSVADEVFPNDKVMHDKLVWELGGYFIDNPNAKDVTITVNCYR